MNDCTPKPAIEAKDYWLPIKDLPRGHHDGDTITVDLLVKSWDPDSDKFVFTRLPNCTGEWRWRKSEYLWDSMSSGQRAVGFVPLPPLPTEFP